MKWIILLLVVGYIGCISGPASSILTPSLSVNTVEQDKAVATEDDGMTTHPYNIISGKGINPVLKKRLLYKYKYGEPSLTMYSFPLFVVD
jgi:hypothetical protein